MTFAAAAERDSAKKSAIGHDPKRRLEICDRYKVE